jgi:hypothetical protein
MKGKDLIITGAMAILITIAGVAYAGGGMGGGMGGGIGGGMGGGMGGGQGMMGFGSIFSNPWGGQSRTNQNYQNQQKETQRLREEVRAKRQELSDLYRAEKPNKEMINRKIEELSRLERELDQEMSGRY